MPIASTVASPAAHPAASAAVTDILNIAVIELWRSGIEIEAWRGEVGKTEDTAMMIPAAASLRKRYGQIRQPTTIIVGSGDRIVDADKHSVRLHKAIPGSDLRVQRDEGHMLLYDSSHRVKQAVINMDTRPRRRLPELETV